MSKVMKIILAALLLVSCGGAQASFTLTIGGICPQGSSYPSDGCASAPGGNYQYTNFFTSRASQSGQGTYATRPPWNVAGVDYSVGIPTGTVLKDPSTSPPSGCTYSSNVLTCNGTGSLTIDGYDFSLHNCIFLDINGYTGNIIIQNSSFAMGSSTACQTGNYGLVALESTTNGSSLTVQSNVFNGNAHLYPTIGNYLVFWDVYRTTGTSLYQYNAFIDSIARPIETTSAGNWVAQYNYFEGLNYGNAAHGELNMMASTATGVNFTAQYNTELNPTNYGGGATSWWYISSGSNNGQTFGTVNIKNNTSVTNLYNGAGGTVVVSTDTEFGYNNVSTANIQNNYVDPTGLYSCYSNSATITTLNMSGNINLIDGSSISDMTPANCHGHH